MKMKYRLPLFILLFIWAIFSYAQEVPMPKAVMIIAQGNFRDEELLEPKKILEDAGVEVKIASTAIRPLKGMLGATITPDMLVSEIKVQDYDAIIFVGGTGASQYWHDPFAHKLAQEAVAQDKVLAAICIAPVTLANAGVLHGREATVWASEAEQLKRQGAKYSAKPVAIDAKIITASGPQAAKEFAQAILKALK